MLQAKQLALRRGDEWLFKNLSFQLHPGQLMWLRGQNGRGKTSLLRLVVNLGQPDAGTLQWNGQSLTRSEDFRSKLVFLGHNNGLKDDLTASEALGFLASLHGRDSNAKSIENALRKLCIHHRRKRSVRTLSQGQRKRVALARLALEEHAGLWVLDEPFDSLDQAGIEIVNGLLTQHLARQGSVLLTSHLPLNMPGTEVNLLDLDATEQASAQESEP